MQIDEAAGVISPIAGVTDLGPLAWVLDELRKSLDVANKSLKRFVRDTEAARGTDSGSVDASQLRMARQQMHQAVGALEMVGLTAPAHMLRAMESAVQRVLERPGKCNEASAVVLGRAAAGPLRRAFHLQRRRRRRAARAGTARSGAHRGDLRFQDLRHPGNPAQRRDRA